MSNPEKVQLASASNLFQIWWTMWEELKCKRSILQNYHVSFSGLSRPNWKIRLNSNFCKHHLSLNLFVCFLPYLFIAYKHQNVAWNALFGLSLFPRVGMLFLSTGLWHLTWLCLIFFSIEVTANWNCKTRQDVFKCSCIVKSRFIDS